MPNEDRDLSFKRAEEGWTANNGREDFANSFGLLLCIIYSILIKLQGRIGAVAVATKRRGDKRKIKMGKKNSANQSHALLQAPCGI